MNLHDKTRFFYKILFLITSILIITFYQHYKILKDNHNFKTKVEEELRRTNEILFSSILSNNENTNKNQENISDKKTNIQLQYFFDKYYSDMDEEKKKTYIKNILKYSDQYRIPPLLIASIIKKESDFDPKALGPPIKNKYYSKNHHQRAIGLGQIMWQAWKKELKELGYTSERDLLDAEKNIHASTNILYILLKESDGDVEKALSRYLGKNQSKYIIDILKTYTEIHIEVHNLQADQDMKKLAMIYGNNNIE